MRKGAFGVMALALLATACGNSGEQRSASGGLSGAAIGALAGGPVGALIGAGVGAGAGTATPESADTMAMKALGKEGTSRAAVKDAQQKLADVGFYHGKIDGLMGPQTKEALSAYQQQNGLKQTARLDKATRDHLAQVQQGSSTTAGARPAETTGSGSSTPPPGSTVGTAPPAATPAPADNSAAPAPAGNPPDSTTR
jgi:peptidoglycan hydrolase-like protein with peptidoglycan-binding domain